MLILLEESMAGKQIANLTTAMKNGEKYVNVQFNKIISRNPMINNNVFKFY